MCACVCARVCVRARASDSMLSSHYKTRREKAAGPFHGHTAWHTCEGVRLEQRLPERRLDGVVPVGQGDRGVHRLHRRLEHVCHFDVLGQEPEALVYVIPVPPRRIEMMRFCNFVQQQ